MCMYGSFQRKASELFATDSRAIHDFQNTRTNRELRDTFLANFASYSGNCIRSATRAVTNREKNWQATPDGLRLYCKSFFFLVRNHVEPV